MIQFAIIYGICFGLIAWFIQSHRGDLKKPSKQE